MYIEIELVSISSYFNRKDTMGKVGKNLNLISELFGVSNATGIQFLKRTTELHIAKSGLKSGDLVTGLIA